MNTLDVQEQTKRKQDFLLKKIKNITPDQNFHLSKQTLSFVPIQSCFVILSVPFQFLLSFPVFHTDLTNKGGKAPSAVWNKQNHNTVFYNKLWKKTITYLLLCIYPAVVIINIYKLTLLCLFVPLFNILYITTHCKI